MKILKKQINKLTVYFTFLAIIALTGGCEEHYTPKPRAYFDIALPEKSYLEYTSDCPFSLEVPAYSQIEIIRTNRDSCWFNLSFPKNNAKVHFTYLSVSADVTPMIEDAYQMAFKHEMKADAIGRTSFINDSSKVYGMVYDLQGNVASPMQFYITDSSHHFLRGSMYFNHIPNADSVAPVLAFLRDDIVHLIETLEWK